MGPILPQSRGERIEVLTSTGLLSEGDHTIDLAVPKTWALSVMRFIDNVEVRANVASQGRCVVGIAPSSVRRRTFST